MLKTIVILMLVIFMSTICYSQERGEISGIVIDRENDEPIEAVNVYLKNSKLGTYTKADGSFKFGFTGDIKDVLIISHVSYKGQSIPVDLEAGEKKTMKISIVPKMIDMKAIDVIGNTVQEQVFNAENFINIVPREVMEEKFYENTSDVLLAEPGILVQKTTHGHGAPIIRGLIGKYVLLLYDGVRLNKPTFRFGGNQYLNTVAPEAVSDIVVTRGPSSVEYGSDAIGGTINLIPASFYAKSSQFQFKTEAMMRFSSADRGQNYSFKLAGGNKKLSFMTVGSYKNIGDLRPGNGGKPQSPTGWSEIDGSIGIKYTINSNNSLDFNYLTVNQDNVPRYDKYAANEYQTYIYEPQIRELASLSYNYKPVDSWIDRLKWNLSYQREKEGKIQQKVGSSTVNYMMAKIYTYGTYFHVSSIWAENQVLTGGFEYYRDIVRSSGEKEQNSGREEIRGEFPDNSIYNSMGMHLKNEYLMSQQINITTGLRYSNVSFESPMEEPWGTINQQFSNLSGLIGISFKPYSAYNIVGSYSRGFRAPNFNDTVVLKVSNSGVDAPSPFLEPEISNNFELGLKVNEQNHAGGVFLFYNNLTGLIERKFGTYKGLSFFDDNGNGVQDENEAPIFQKYNSGDAYICGSEFYFSWMAKQDIRIDGNCFYIYGHNTTQDEPMSRIPPFMGKVGVRWYRKANMWLETFVRFAAKQDRLSERDVLDTRILEGGTPGYKTLNVRGGMEFSTVKINVMVDNIFDELYREHGSGIYSPGRNFSVSLKVVP